METFSPARCSDSIYGRETDGEREAYFYRAINALRGGLSALQQRVDELSNSTDAGIAKNANEISSIKSQIVTINSQIASLNSGFTALRQDNDRFQAEVSASNDNTLKRVSAVEGLANSVSASVIDLQTRVSKLEGVINPDELNKILERVQGLSEEIKQEVARQIAVVEAKLQKNLADGIAAQNEAIAGISSVANSASSVAGAAQQSASQANEAVSKLRTDMVAADTQLNSDLQNEIQRATNAESRLNTDLNAEKEDRRKADLVIQRSVDDVNAALGQEVKDRQAADTMLCEAIDKNQKAIEDESKARIAADTKLQGAITDEANIRLTQDQLISASVSAETKRAQAKEKEISDGLQNQKNRATQTEQQIADWVNGNGADYHIKNSDIDVSLGAGLAGQMSQVRAKQEQTDKSLSDLAGEVRSDLNAFGNRVTALDNRLTADEKKIEENHTAIFEEIENRVEAVSNERRARSDADIALSGRLDIVEEKTERIEPIVDANTARIAKLENKNLKVVSADAANSDKGFAITMINVNGTTWGVEVDSVRLAQFPKNADYRALLPFPDKDNLEALLIQYAQNSTSFNCRIL